MIMPMMRSQLTTSMMKSTLVPLMSLSRRVCRKELYMEVRNQLYKNQFQNIRDIEMAEMLHGWHTYVILGIMLLVIHMHDN